ncbi:hypothetical protein HXX76_003044 [Chlamydomonas incerta]|uniref:ABC transporter domain-containing protein n=1 Tax=Chlamydomonas incerta TaxID=51695 RepID=A0A835TRI1_CHLIN|nr:hypothetical protein HXX76_003044 [Chlamydomonas incerta]|eukprot:KAG2442970.1 hypothetical protein HXX76_003044 [Chlamydomonas incerta]
MLSGGLRGALAPGRVASGGRRAAAPHAQCPHTDGATSVSGSHLALDPLPCSTSYHRSRSSCGASTSSSSGSGSASSLAGGIAVPPATLTKSAVRRTSSHNSVIVHDLRLKLGSRDVKRPVLQGVDLQVRRGSLHMLLGPNGCGKSTLLKVLGGLLVPDSGLIDADQPSGFVFQNPDHQVVMPTVAADVAFGLGRYVLTEEEVSAAVRSSLRLVNMEDFMYRATHTLSGGQRQRVAIAGALAEDPKLLLLDELTTFLDREDQFGVLGAVKNITSERQDVTAIWVTHRFEELQFADAASYMENGRVVFTGTPDEAKAYMRKLGAPV